MACCNSSSCVTTPMASTCCGQGLVTGPTSRLAAQSQAWWTGQALATKCGGLSTGCNPCIIPTIGCGCTSPAWAQCTSFPFETTSNWSLKGVLPPKCATCC